jgi:hypothetical protein
MIDQYGSRFPLPPIRFTQTNGVDCQLCPWRP